MLAAVTRKRNEVERLLHNHSSELVAISTAFQEYLQKVENSFSACGEQHIEWLSEHEESIAAFMDKVELVLATLHTREHSQQTGEDDALSECSWKTNSSSEIKN